MIVFKCKMCGGEMELEEGATVAECPYCLTKQTLPKLDNDKRANMYDRANHFRRQNEYDKAMAIFESVLQEDRTDAEAYQNIYKLEYCSRIKNLIKHIHCMRKLKATKMWIRFLRIQNLLKQQLLKLSIKWEML